MSGNVEFKKPSVLKCLLNGPETKVNKVAKVDFSFSTYSAIYFLLLPLK